MEEKKKKLTEEEVENKLAEVEKETVLNRKIMNTPIRGMEDVALSIPYYKVVQPGSTNVNLASGNEAPVGSLFNGNDKKSVTSLRCAILRVKRQKREVVNAKGETKTILSEAILGIDPENYSPFILNASLASFAAVSRLKTQMKNKKVSAAWEYPVIITTEKREEQKQTDEGIKMVKYYVLTFTLEDEPFSREEIALLDQGFQEFAQNLDGEGTDVEMAEPNEHVEEQEETVEAAKDLPFD